MCDHLTLASYADTPSALWRPSEAEGGSKDGGEGRRRRPRDDE